MKSEIIKLSKFIGGIKVYRNCVHNRRLYTHTIAHWHTHRESTRTRLTGAKEIAKQKWEKCEEGMQAKVIKAQRRKTNCDVEPRREGKIKTERERERKCTLSSCRLSTSLSPAAHTHAEITAHTKKKSRKQLTKHDLPVSFQLFCFYFSADFLRLFLLRISFLLPA